MHASFLPFAMPDIGPMEIENVNDCLRSGWLTTGPRVKQFEAAFAQAVSAKHAVAVNSATAAMHLALEAIGLQADDEVITTTYTFAATAEVIRYFGARPVLVDVCADTLNIDIARIEDAVTPRTKAIIPVHFAGLPADLNAIFDIARRHQLAVIEDAAHAFPASGQGRFIGMPCPLPGVKHVVCFSFYATKTITTGEGGMLCTNDDDIEARARIMALHGISRDAWKRYTAEGSWYYEVVAPGFKYNLTDLAAAIGLGQLARADAMRKRREEIAHRYNLAFGSLPEFQTPADDPGCVHAWHLYVLRLTPERLLIDRAAFIEQLKLLNIGSSVHFIPLHLHPYYRTTYGYEPNDFPVAYDEYRRAISLPVYSKMSDLDVDSVIEAVLDIRASHLAMSPVAAHE